MPLTKRDKIKLILNGDNYCVQNNALCFLPGDRIPRQTASGDLLGRVQDRLKITGKLYRRLLVIFRPLCSSIVYRREIQNCLKNLTDQDIVINFGSGPYDFKGRTDFINVDLFAFDNVDIVADASNIPFKTDSVDFVINIAMLEHVKKPWIIIEEMRRILKPGGRILAFVPFMQPYHAAPFDFYRWNQQGLRELFSSFNETKVFVACGPTSGMLWILEEWIATLLSFGFKTIHDLWFLFLMVLLFPVKYFDLILNNFPTAEKIASGFSILAKK